MRAAKASSAWDLGVCPVGGVGAGASVSVPGSSTGPSRGGGVAAIGSTGTLPVASGTGRASNVGAPLDPASGREDCSGFRIFGGHPAASNWSGCADLGETGLVTGGASRGWAAPFGRTAACGARMVAAVCSQSKAALLAGATGISSGATSGTPFGITFGDSQNTAGSAGGGVAGAGTKQGATKPAVSMEAGLSFSASALGGSPFSGSAGSSGSDVPPASCCGSGGKASLRKKAKVSPAAGPGRLSCFLGAPPAARGALPRAGNGVASGREPEEITNMRLQIERHWQVSADQRVSGTGPVKKLPDSGIRQNIGRVDRGPLSFRRALSRDFAEI